MPVLSIKLPMTLEGWERARQHVPNDSCGVYVFFADAEWQQVPLRVGQTTRTFRQRLFDDSGSHRQAFYAPHVGDHKYEKKWPNYVSFFSQIEALAANRFLTNTTVSLLAFPMGAARQRISRAEIEACRALVPIWEMKGTDGRGVWKKQQWNSNKPELIDLIKLWIEHKGRQRLDAGSLLRRIEQRPDSR